ncbi:GAF domain-containing protein [Mycetocola zhujimingii]|uniref:GAF domain-containing protein n=1 Tax=Mycetocola zhujimingii TaxID=2079792 RepID=UPI000D3CDF6F|nr:GAF domain-containing protein [Mycetocola zhujimingii]AWB86084.1 hypothetical protein C3E77_05280 [Mycetocola zhujimingii]
MDGILPASNGTITNLQIVERELQRQIAQERSEQRKLRTLSEIGLAAAGDRATDQVLQRLVDSSLDLFGARYAVLGLIQLDGQIERVVQSGLPADAGSSPGQLPHPNQLLRAVLESGGPVRVGHRADAPKASGSNARPSGMQSDLGVPIRLRGEERAALCVARSPGDPFSRFDEDLASQFAALAGAAIDNARRFEEAERGQRLGAVISDMRVRFLAFDENEVLRTVILGLPSLFPAAIVAVAAPVPSEKKMRIEVALGRHAQAVEGERYHNSIAAQAAEENAVTASVEPRTVLRPEGPWHSVGPHIAAPLVVAGGARYALCAAREPGDVSFTRSERGTLADFAFEAGEAIATVTAAVARRRKDITEDHDRIARDLHDNVIQRLYATGLGLQMLGAENPQHTAHIDGHTAEIDIAISRIRDALVAKGHAV